ncbi:MAG: hypothetical protein IJO85_03785 [Lachnospiraceae bacterium]|nr:hypothetical protein [Lachnospiraceae bacterium]
MKDPQTAYFFKKFYGNVIKWWFVSYNTDAIKIWPSKAEEEAARIKEEEEKELLLLESAQEETPDESYNATTGSYSGLYGQGPMDDVTQSMLDEIMHQSSSQTSIDSLLQSSAETSDVILPPEQEEIIKEANIIYERLLREAKEDEERKAAEIEALKRAVEANS